MVRGGRPARLVVFRSPAHAFAALLLVWVVPDLPIVCVLSYVHVFLLLSAAAAEARREQDMGRPYVPGGGGANTWGGGEGTKLTARGAVQLQCLLTAC